MSLRLGTGHAVDILEHVGVEQIEYHVCELTAQLRDGLRRIRGFCVITPDPWEFSSGITSLDFPNLSAAQVRTLIERMWLEYRVVVKFQNEFSGIRISVACFNSHDEVDRLLSGLAELVPEM